jgi:hypothetical protein
MKTIYSQVYTIIKAKGEGVIPVGNLRKELRVMKRDEYTVNVYQC